MREPWASRAKTVKDMYNGDFTVPLPELDEAEKPAIANLLASGLDQFAMRAASVLPNIVYPVVRPGIDKSELLARQREMAANGWMDMNRMQNKLRRRFRFLIGYGMAPAQICAVGTDNKDPRNMPHWRIRNPLCTYPAYTTDPDCMEPPDCIFTEARSLGWLTRNYPRQASALYKGEARPDTLFDVLEYVDAVETVVLVVGSKHVPGYWVDPAAGTLAQVELERIPNRIELCPVVIPGRITLDRLQGQFD